jgi:hypothetical protein
MESSDKDGHNGHDRRNGHPGPFFGESPSRDDEVAHREWHAQMIASWEAMHGDLAERYGPDLATKLVDLQRMSAEACAAGHPGLSMLIGVVGDLVYIADGDNQILSFGAHMLQSLVAQIAALTHARPKSGKVRRKPRRKPRRAPGEEGD